MDYLQHNEYGDCPPHVCKEHKCSECNSTFVGNTCLNCKENRDRQQDERDKKILEAKINSHQVMLKQIKAMKGWPGYSEHTVQQLEQQLAEMITRYKSKYGELPSSLNDDKDKNNDQERERETNFPITNWNTAIRSHI